MRQSFIGFLLIAAAVCNFNSTATAAEIKLNKSQWDAVSKEEQQKIITGLKQTKLLGLGDTIVGDPNAQEFDNQKEFAPLTNPIIGGVFSGPCKLACDIAAASALTWCGANTVGLALTACIAAAVLGRDECKKRC